MTYGRKTGGLFHDTWVVNIYEVAGWSISYRNHEGVDDPTTPVFYKCPRVDIPALHTFDGHLAKNFYLLI